LCSCFSWRSLWAGHLARFPLGRFCPWWQFVTSFPFYRIWIAGHDHPLKVDCLGRLAVHHLADQDLPVQVDPAINELQWFLSNRFTIDVEQNFVSEDTKMEFVPLGVKHLRHIPGEGLKLPIEVQDGKLHCLPRWVETYGKLGVPLCVGDPYKMPRIGPRTPVPERRHKAELLRQALIEDTKGVHPQVGCRIYPVRSLHLVRATHPGNTGVSVEVYIQLELSDEVKRLKIIITRLIISTRVSDFLCIARSPGSVGCRGGRGFWRHQGLVATVGSSGVLVKVLFSVRIILIIVPIDVIVIFFQVLLFNLWIRSSPCSGHRLHILWSCLRS